MLLFGGFGAVGVEAEEGGKVSLGGHDGFDPFCQLSVVDNVGMGVGYEEMFFFYDVGKKKREGLNERKGWVGI